MPPKQQPPQLQQQQQTLQVQQQQQPQIKNGQNSPQVKANAQVNGGEKNQQKSLIQNAQSTKDLQKSGKNNVLINEHHNDKNHETLEGKTRNIHSKSPMKAQTQVKQNREHSKYKVDEIPSIVMRYDNSYIVRKLKMMFKVTTEDKLVKRMAKEMIRDRNDKHVVYAVHHNHAVNLEDDSHVDRQLRNWRRKERKQEFIEAINNFAVKEALPKTFIQQKIKIVEDNEWLLGNKEGDKIVEERVGIMLSINQKKFVGVQHFIEDNNYEDPDDKKLQTIKEKLKERQQKELDEKQQEEVQRLLFKLKEEKRARKEKRRREKLEKLKEDQRMQEVESKRKIKHDQDEIEQKRKRISESISKMKEDREKAFHSLYEDQSTKVISQPLYKKLEYRYKDLEDSEIEKRKKHLQSLRELHQPIDRSDILEHSRKMEEIVREKVEERKRDRMQRYQNASYDYSKYQSKFLDKVLEQDQQVMIEKEKKDQERLKVLEQREVYDKYVKEMHWPKVSEKKKSELEILKLSLKTPVLKKKSPRSSVLGHNSYKDNDEDNSTYGILGHHRASSDNHDGSITRSRVIKWPDNPMVPKPKEKKEGKIIDWLREQRMKNQNDAQNSITISTQNHDWRKELSKLDNNGRDRYDMVLEKAKEMEVKAKRKQQIINQAKGGGTVEDIIQVNDMYVESIKAKLELLNDISRK
ncbi:UNKNOWN [Stylonychia lemnae]|uniref:Uncharacterized protein n=1 Tax=Stylonychia lemnae TaxID=5949 RepID=A0A078AKW0_STYLE|nr:UNKNOWN [Stylonychia lemnae]|eukprot:CDW82839.1 UNKNOWN [Stylonychia lemnae]